MVGTIRVVKIFNNFILIQTRIRLPINKITLNIIEKINVNINIFLKIGYIFLYWNFKNLKCLNRTLKIINGIFKNVLLGSPLKKNLFLPPKIHKLSAFSLFSACAVIGSLSWLSLLRGFSLSHTSTAFSSSWTVLSLPKQSRFFVPGSPTAVLRMSS